MLYFVLSMKILLYALIVLFASEPCFFIRLNVLWKKLNILLGDKNNIVSMGIFSFCCNYFSSCAAVSRFDFQAIKKCFILKVLQRERYRRLLTNKRINVSGTHDKELRDFNIMSDILLFYFLYLFCKIYCPIFQILGSIKVIFNKISYLEKRVLIFFT